MTVSEQQKAMISAFEAISAPMVALKIARLSKHLPRSKTARELADKAGVALSTAQECWNLFQALGVIWCKPSTGRRTAISFTQLRYVANLADATWRGLLHPPRPRDPRADARSRAFWRNFMENQ